MEVIAEFGVAGTTHRAVTERAGVPLATVSYYFSSIGELIEEALRRFAEQRAESLAPPRRPEGAEEPTPAAVAAWATDRFMDVPEATRLAWFEMVISSVRHPELAEPKHVALGSYERAAQAAISALGEPEDTDRARAFMALALGFSLLRLADPRESDAANLRDSLQHLFHGRQDS
ncbi:transcriptional regulator, TetR family [Amycolatopsis marina]|uniref:Transcriptional regulator, TetR family n=1 Tax=Amycolatopsis marina TaxID=490629 RepID=A0A1I1B609_9PSEU|nr:transcriptional regulator, TetR family [Amycolatopsis marina]